MLVRWIYISESRIPAANADKEVGDIVNFSMRRNRSIEVTGALLFTGLHFAQYIEGPAASVDALKTSILRDPRHGEIKTIADGSLSHRHFLNWSLAYAGPSRFVANTIEAALDKAMHGGRNNIDRLVKLMTEFTIQGRS